MHPGETVTLHCVSHLSSSSDWFINGAIASKNWRQCSEYKNKSRENSLSTVSRSNSPNNMSEKLCLQWNDFQENVKSAFGNLREDKHFTDVTLVCENGQQLGAHKVILAASSPFFQKLLERNKHPHPLIYMRGLKSKDLSAIVDFLYCGEANVYQENLDSFLAIAEELQLKGLMGKNDETEENVLADEKPEFQVIKPTNIPPMNNCTRMKRSFQNRQTKNEAETNNTVALSSHFSGNLVELEQKVKSLMEKSQNNYGNNYGNKKADRCTVCGKEGMGNAIIDHIEAKHLEGIVLPCNQCEKTFRCRNSLKWPELNSLF